MVIGLSSDILPYDAM